MYYLKIKKEFKERDDDSGHFVCVDTIYVLIWRKFSIIWNSSLVFHEFFFFIDKNRKS